MLSHVADTRPRLAADVASKAAENAGSLIPVGLFVLGVASRLPFRSQLLYHWDSVNFALATVHLDVSQGQPHSPGYILYVALGWLGNLVTQDPQSTFVYLSALFSGLSAAALFLLGEAMFDRRTGLVAALMLLSSPLFWFYGEIALPHTLDAFFVILLALFLYRAWQGRANHLLVAAVILALAAGFRPQTAVFLGPLCLLAACRARPATYLLAGGIAAVLSTLWLVPLLWLTGGPARYLEITAAYSRAFGYWTPTVDLLRGDPSAMAAAGGRIFSYTLYGLGLAALPLFVYAFVAGRTAVGLLRDARGVFFAAWCLPALIFYLLVHMGQQGLVFVYLPALLLLSAAATTALLSNRRVGRRDLLAGGVALVVAVNAVVFVAAPTQLEWPVPQKILTWDTIKSRDQHYLSLTSTIRRVFAPERTILASANWRHLAYYLPEYRLYRLPSQDADGEAVASMGEGDAALPLSVQSLGLPAATSAGVTVALIDRDLRQVSPEVAARLVRPSVPLPYALTLEPEEELRWQEGRLQLARSPSR